MPLPSNRECKRCKNGYFSSSMGLGYCQSCVYAIVQEYDFNQGNPIKIDPLCKSLGSEQQKT